MAGSSIFSQISEALESLKLSRTPVEKNHQTELWESMVQHKHEGGREEKKGRGEKKDEKKSGRKEEKGKNTPLL